MIEKHGDLREDSQGDFEFGKKAEYYDAEGFQVADEANKDKLKAPRVIRKDSGFVHPNKKG